MLFVVNMGYDQEGGRIKHDRSLVNTVITYNYINDWFYYERP